MRLYKYYDENRVGFLEDGLVRFTQPQAFNDPFEMKPHFSTLASDEYITELLDEQFEEIIRKEFNDLPVAVKNKISYKEFCVLAQSQKEFISRGVKEQSSQQAERLKKVMHDRFEKYVGVFSLSEVPDNLLMWSHYANSHQGYVVEFDAKHPFFNQRKSDKDDFRCLRKVVYSNNRSKPSLFEIDTIDDLLSKSDDWSYECEWRILMALEDSDSKVQQQPYDVYLFKIGFDAVGSVRIGARASDVSKKRIMSAIESNPELTKLPVYQMKLDEEQFKVNAERIR